MDKHDEIMEYYAKNGTLPPHTLEELDDYPYIRDFVKVNLRKLKKTNQKVSDETGLPISTVSKYLSGATASSSVHTVGRVCNSARFNLNAYFGIVPLENDQIAADDDKIDRETLMKLHDLESDLEHAKDIQTRQDRTISRLEEGIKKRESNSAFQKNVICALAAVCIALTFALVFYIVLDHRNPSVGVFGDNPSTLGVILYILIAAAAAVLTATLLRKRRKK